VRINNSREPSLEHIVHTKRHLDISRLNRNELMAYG
jgi:hypothetical protein